jgi:YrbI family 3-deoxy-D-manno-octulosonate 8-phosphate phosphatase
VVIPARGGSKGIPRKNLKTVGGVPLIVRAIRAALLAGRVGRVVVSTDDYEIGEISQEAGADVVWRPDEISGDSASSEAALLHVLEQLASSEGYSPSHMGFLQCTSPFLVAADVDGVLELVQEGGFDTAFTATRSHGFLWKLTRDRAAEGVNHDKAKRPMRQQRQAEFLETGAAYAMNVQGFVAAKHRFFGRTGIYEVPRLRSMEIDEPDDLVLANALCGVVERVSLTDHLPRNVKALVLDFDGVLTDNRVLVMEDGREGVVCSRADGMGISMLKMHGVKVLILSKERNPVVSARAAKLGVECIQGADEKLEAFRKWLDSHGVSLDEVVYVGNDVNDADCLRTAGCGICVEDGHAEAKAAADVVVPVRGGEGAVRLICELILERNKA